MNKLLYHNTFLIDSGCSHHIINDKSNLSNYTDFTNNIKLLDKYKIRCAGGQLLQIEGVGRLGLLHTVYYVPQAQHNLISVSALTLNDYTLTFNSNSVYLENNRTKHRTQIGNLSNNLYIYDNNINLGDIEKGEAAEDLTNNAADINKTECSAFISHKWSAEGKYNIASSAHMTENFYMHNAYIDNSETSVIPKLDLLHRRFCHANIGSIKKLIRLDAATGLQPSRSELTQEHSCDGCSMSKQHKNTPKSDKSIYQNRYINIEHPTQLYIEVVFTDLLGPFNVQSITHDKYLITFTEKFSRYRWVYAMRSKDETLFYIQKFLADIASHNFTVLSMYSDNGGEFTSAELDNFLNLCTIAHRFTSPHTPSANAHAEQFNRTLVERARACLISSKLPRYLWSEIMKTITYTYNRMCAPDSDHTPYYLLFKRKPDVSNLKAIGCLAYCYDFNLNRVKLDASAIRGVMVGYDDNSAAYIIYIPNTGALLRTFHVSFNEHKLYYTDADIDPTETAHLDQPSDILHDSDTSMPVQNSTNTNKYNTRSSSVSTSTSSSSSSSTIHTPSLNTGTGTSEIPQRASARLKEKMNAQAHLAMEEQEEEGTTNNTNFNNYYDDTEYADDVPKNVRDIEKFPDRDLWYAALDSENESIRKLDVLEVVNRNSLPVGKNIVSSMYIFKRKLDGRRKVRLVARGFSQRQGEDYFDTYAPVVSKNALRMLLSVAAVNRYFIYQIDIKTAFLHVTLDVEIYMEAPEGMDIPKDCVLRLKK